MRATHELNYSARKRVWGITLIELMIAMIIGLIVTGAVIQVFLASSQSYRLNEGVSRIQENLRFALDSLQREARMAGYAGCTRNITNWLNPIGTGYTDVTMDGAAVYGWEFQGTGVGNLYAIGTAGNWSNGTGTALPAAIANAALPGSDILVINRAVELPCTVQGPPTSTSASFQVTSGNPVCGTVPGEIVVAVTASCEGGDMFQPQTAGTNANTLSRGSGGSPGNTAPASRPFANGYDSNARLLRWQSTAYYVGQGASGEPALFELRLRPAGQPQELVESVESMQILFGRDTNTNRQVNDYVAATTVTDWNEVASVRIGLLLRSPEQVNTELDTRVYHVVGTRIDPIDDRRIRQVGATTIGFRNRLE